MFMYITILYKGNCLTDERYNINIQLKLVFWASEEIYYFIFVRLLIYKPESRGAAFVASGTINPILVAGRTRYLIS